MQYVLQTLKTDLINSKSVSKLLLVCCILIKRHTEISYKTYARLFSNVDQMSVTLTILIDSL